MPYSTNAELPKSVRDALPSDAQSVFRNVFNSASGRGLSEERSFASAWAALSSQGWEKGKDGKWHKPVSKWHKTVSKSWGVLKWLSKANEAAKEEGVMVSLSVPSNIASDLAVEGGEAAADLHITLAYLGKVSALPDNFEQILNFVVDDVTRDAKPISVNISGISRFPASEHSDGKEVVYATVDSMDLREFREELVEHLQEAGLPVRADFEYTPHITLKYADIGSAQMYSVPKMVILFESVDVVIGGYKWSHGLRKNTVTKNDYDEVDTSIIFKFKDINADKRQVFGWAYVANSADGSVVVDHSGDVVKIDELEKASYEFVKSSRKAGEMHERIGVGTLIESMIFTKEKQELLGIEKGYIHEGWWVGFEVEQEVFDKIKSGEYKAFSIGGTGKRRVIED